jgi:hypothetical protein
MKRRKRNEKKNGSDHLPDKFPPTLVDSKPAAEGRRKSLCGSSYKILLNVLFIYHTDLVQSRHAVCSLIIVPHLH